MSLINSEMFTSVSGSLIALFVCMVAGFLGRKLRIINDEVSSGLTGVLVKITLPCTVFMSMQRPFSQTLLKECAIIFAVSLVFYLSGILIGALMAKLLKAKPGEKSVWQFVLTFSNVGYMGFPVMMAVYGEDGLLYTSMANVAFNVLAFTIGTGLFARHADHVPKRGKTLSVILNPAIVSTLIGFLFFLLSLSLPKPISNGVSMMSNMTSPLSMLVVGGILAKSDLKRVFGGLKMYVIIFLRLIAIPVVSYFILSRFIENRMMLGVEIFLLAMPAASLTAIFAEQYKVNSELASKLVFVSTLLSLVTIPAISLLLS